MYSHRELKKSQMEQRVIEILGPDCASIVHAYTDRGAHIDELKRWAEMHGKTIGPCWFLNHDAGHSIMYGWVNVFSESITNFPWTRTRWQRAKFCTACNRPSFGRLQRIKHLLTFLPEAPA